ncbi:hypothetical protein QRB40_28975, partial [Mycobacterium intracellulare subsp. chimaera]|nr:hypothetical protein [Mycobacterium intracellulare subsp. chimaera]
VDRNQQLRHTPESAGPQNPSNQPPRMEPIRAVTPGPLQVDIAKVSLAEVAVAVSGGRLLASGWPGEWVQHESTLPPRQMRP